jgi:hypothetical protein
MFWNKDNKTTPTYFDELNSSSGTADNEFGLFYKNQSTCVCEEDCCIQLEGGGVQDVIFLEGLTDCISLEGCEGELSIPFMQALINQYVP